MLLLMTDEFMNWKKEIQKKEFPAGRICESRWIKHWGAMGLLFGGNDVGKDKWTKFSFVDLIWLKMILKLRQFGVSLEDIKIIKKFFEKEFGPKGIVDLTSWAVQRMSVEIILTKPNDQSTKVEVTGPFYVKDDKKPASDTGATPRGSFLSICMNELILNFVLDFENQQEEKHYKEILKFNLLSESETELLHLIRNKLINEIVIITTDNTEKIKSVNPEKYISKILYNSYDEIKYNINGKDVSFKKFKTENVQLKKPLKNGNMAFPMKPSAGKRKAGNDGYKLIIQEKEKKRTTERKT